jgi:hypothetical protein
MVSALIKLDRTRCSCFRRDVACNCDFLEVEHHVVGVVDDIGNEWSAEVLGVADDRGDVISLMGRELTWAEQALIEEAERIERLSNEARIPYTLPEGARC